MGQASLLPPSMVNLVLSEPRIIGINVAPSGKPSWTLGETFTCHLMGKTDLSSPPPVTSPHLRIYPIRLISVTPGLFWAELHGFSQQGGGQKGFDDRYGLAIE